MTKPRNHQKLSMPFAESASDRIATNDRAIRGETRRGLRGMRLSVARADDGVLLRPRAEQSDAGCKKREIEQCESQQAALIGIHIKQNIHPASNDATVAAIIKPMNGLYPMSLSYHACTIRSLYTTRAPSIRLISFMRRTSSRFNSPTTTDADAASFNSPSANERTRVRGAPRSHNPSNARLAASMHAHRVDIPTQPPVFGEGFGLHSADGSKSRDSTLKTMTRSCNISSAPALIDLSL